MGRALSQFNGSLGTGFEGSPSVMELATSFVAPARPWDEDGATCGSIQTTANRLEDMSRKWRALPPECFHSCFGCNHGVGCCSSRGKCVRGICICEHGARGPDCAEGRDVSSEKTLSSGVRIYVYDLPDELALRPYSLRVCQQTDTSMYSAEQRFLRLLLADRGVRTENPSEADLFYVPTFTTYGPAGNTGCDRARMLMIQRSIATRYPFWSKCDGCDHVFFMTNDRGACGLGPAGANPIIVSHWGLLGPYAPMMTEFGMIDGHYVNGSLLEAGMRSGRWCHSPHKDIVVPPYYAHNGRGKDATSSEKKCLLSFAGGIWGYNNRPHRGRKNLSYYSQGMRQAIFMRYSQPSADRRIQVMEHAAPDSIFSSSEFCLAPSGGGFGIRLMKAAALNCVPLVAQPFVVQPFEDLLRYDEFSVRVGHEHVNDLADYLEKKKHGAASMRRRLHAAHDAFSWDRNGLAYNYTILALCLRAKELQQGTATQGKCTQLAAGLPFQSRRLRVHPHWFPVPLKSAIRSMTAMRNA